MKRDIIVFTLHKSASMFIHEQCSLLSRLSGIAYNSPNAKDTDLDARRLLTDKTIWQDRSGCFAPIRFFVEVPQFENYDVILHLRDPRDVLVSMFFAYSYIHAGEIEGNTGYRKDTAAKGIDEFVLSRASGDMNSNYAGSYGTGAQIESLIGNVHQRYRTYIDQLLTKPNVVLVKYEEMITDYPKWLQKFIKPFRIDDEDKVIETLVAQSPGFFPKPASDTMKHLRHVTPGDHKNKLMPETIAALNDIFSDVLGTLGYEYS